MPTLLIVDDEDGVRALVRMTLNGDSYRILFIHVPCAWMSLFVYVTMAIQAGIALVWRIKLCEILAMACALHQTLEENSRYDGVSISRPVIALGKDIGFLPGTLEEKMRPWLQPYYDALEVLIPSKPPKEPQFAAKKVSKKKHWKREDAMTPMSSPSCVPVPTQRLTT